jgi:superfamily II RNA helicase
MEYQGLTLDPFQERAVRYVEEGRSVLVAAPTGTGKTLIADYLIEEILGEDGHVVYTAPVKALSNQKYREYTEQFGRDKVGLVTGDIVINPYAPLRIMTTEILRNILLQEPVEIAGVDESHTWTGGTAQIRDLDQLRAVVIDEIHFVDDPDRGTVWEELLIYLPTEIRILGLSATLSNLNQFADWLSEIRDEKVEVVREEQRAVPLSFFLANKLTGVVDEKKFEKGYRRWKKEQKKQGRGRNRGRGRGRGRGRRDYDSSRTNHIDVFEALGENELPALFFIYSRKLTEKLALQLSHSNEGRQIGKRARTEEIKPILKRFDKEYPGVLRSKTRRALQRGIAYHHAGLHVAMKALVEELYEKRLVEVLYCTSTFALGINMPARTVVFDALTKFNGVDIVPLTVREFMQMAGRAGRRGIDTEGDVVVRMSFGDWQESRPTWHHLTRNEAEPVSSSFNLSFNSVVNLIDRYSEEHIRTILERSFKAFQYRESAAELRQRLEEVESEDLSRSGRKRVATWRRELVEAERPRLWEQFQRKLAFLRTHGYIGDQNELYSSANILQRIQFTEIFVTELVVAGVMEDLAPEEIFGVFTGLVSTLPRRAKVREPADDKWWAIFDQVGAVFESDVVYDSQFLTGQEVVFVPPLMPLGEMWARGDSLDTILKEVSHSTDLSGDIVGAFRRAKDLVGQLRTIYQEDEERRKELTRLIRDVSRDEVQVID